MRADPSLVRSGQWWDHKVPPLIAAAALTMLPAVGMDGPGLLIDVVLFLAAAVGIAAFGHVLNDLADIRTDAIAGAPNQMAPLSPPARAGVLLATLLAGLLPWVWLPRTGTVLALLGTEVGLLTVYSLRPIRLKDRAAAGVLADALYAYVVPIMLTVAVFVQIGGVPAPGWSILAPVAVWMLLMGLRGILWHQIGDLAHDRRAGVRTLATRIGAERGGQLLGWMVLLELAAAATALVTIGVGIDQLWLPLFGAAYLTYRTFQMSILWTEPLRASALKHHNGRIRFIGFVVLNEFVERWLPVAALVVLALEVPLMWVAVVAHLLLFDNAVFEFLRRDLPALPDALNRLAHERRSRRNIRRVADRRRADTAAGPQHVAEHVRHTCRWVFVVCGPEMHVETLGTAVRHLRPLTELEIWVVTDSSRNVVPIDVQGVDHVVDVATPETFDDHQASIWLKTGVHRHLPPGEWCYLDSDIIAVRPGAEAVFEHRIGLVAFSGLTISANRSTASAMGHGQSGHGGTRSCAPPRADPCPVRGGRTRRLGPLERRRVPVRHGQRRIPRHVERAGCCVVRLARMAHPGPGGADRDGVDTRPAGLRPTPGRVQLHRRPGQRRPVPGPGSRLGTAPRGSVARGTDAPPVHEPTRGPRVGPGSRRRGTGHPSDPRPHEPMAPVRGPPTRCPRDPHTSRAVRTAPPTVATEATPDEGHHVVASQDRCGLGRMTPQRDRSVRPPAPRSNGEAG